ncbi:hypothetical protein [Bradyrhizobium sp. B117]|uniref:hypothetical protein n=1 Tax=Bradyrhizobium sp. B117 TaxID=3140246 RepID=UPI003183055D
MKDRDSAIPTLVAIRRSYFRNVSLSRQETMPLQQSASQVWRSRYPLAFDNWVSSKVDALHVRDLVDVVLAY